MLWIHFRFRRRRWPWGLYGPVLHRGQVELGSPMRALLCVGVAYFLIGVLVPVASLSTQGGLQGFTMKGSVAATLGGALGANRAICIIFAFRYGGLPTYVIAVGLSQALAGERAVFNVQHPPKTAPNPLPYLGFVFARLWSRTCALLFKTAGFRFHHKYCFKKLSFFILHFSLG